MTTELAVLGPVEVCLDGTPTALSSRQLRTVLAALILDPRRQATTGRLADLIWDGDAPDNAATHVQVLVSRLRRALGGDQPGAPRIGYSGGSYRLDTASATVDLDAFTAAAEAGRAALAHGRTQQAADQLHQALQLWRGDPLADVTDALRDRELPRLAELRLAATEDLSQARLGLGEHQQVLADLRTLHAEYPDRERLAALLITALTGLGRVAEATQIYHDLRQRLAGEYGIEPGAEVSAAYESALRGRSTPAQPVTGRGPALRLPLAPASFVGREAQLTQLRAQSERTDAAAPRRVIVSGLPGTGKTALALHWAYREHDRFPDGVVFADLHGYDPHGSPAATLATIADILAALGVTGDQIPVDEAAALEFYQTQLRERCLLLVLDNASSSAQVRPLLPAGGSCFTIITSRDHLESLIAREGSAVLRLGPLDARDAADLITMVSGREAAAAHTRIAELCGHLPLALRISAARLAVNPDLAAAALADQLDGAQMPRGGLWALGYEDISVDVRAAFELSYRRTTPAAARLLRLMGALPGGDVSLTALAAAVEDDEARVAATIAELVSASLVDVTAPGRYAMHDLVRLLALHMLADTGEQTDGDTAARRLADFYLAAVSTADRVLRPMRQRPEPALAYPPAHSIAHADQAAALDWLDAEYRNIASCVHDAQRRGWPDAGWQIADCLYSYHLRRNRHAEWMRVDTAAIAAAIAAGDRLGERRMRTGIAAALMYLRRFDDALAQLATALRLAGEIGDPGQTASVHAMMSAACGESGRHADCVEHARAAYPLYLEADMPAGAVTCLVNAGLAQLEMGLPGEAVTTLEDALAQARVHLAEEQEFADVLANLAGAYLAAGRVDDARTTARQAIAVARERQHPVCEAEALVVLADSLAEAQPAVSAGHLRRAAGLFAELGHPQAAVIEERLAAGGKVVASV